MPRKFKETPDEQRPLDAEGDGSMARRKYIVDI